MSNHYFQFKQFKVEQENCAMKVCTDSCLFGAWISVDKNVESILDIGTGTGLLSLMFAQKLNAKIDGVEIDENAFFQTKKNFENSIWKEQLTAFLGDIKSYPFTQQYDFIVCNPPFYHNEFSSVLKEEKIAKHSMHLTLPDLMSSIEKVLNKKGKFAILLPYYRKDEFEKLAARYQFYPEKTIAIKQSTTHDFFRYAGIFSKEKTIKTQEEFIAIKNNHEKYTEEAVSLLKPYYLYL